MTNLMAGSMTDSMTDTMTNTMTNPMTDIKTQCKRHSLQVDRKKEINHTGEFIQSTRWSLIWAA